MKVTINGTPTEISKMLEMLASISNPPPKQKDTNIPDFGIQSDVVLDTSAVSELEELRKLRSNNERKY